MGRASTQRRADGSDDAAPPANTVAMAVGALRHVLPSVKTHLRERRAQAHRIPSIDLRTQALASIETKAFHCMGGGMYALLAGDRREEAIRFIVAYQTISDYLDNLCDRSVSLDPEDFRLLHTSMLHALTPGAGPDCYYRLREEQDDAGYLSGLVATCQDVLGSLPDYEVIAPYLHELAGHYCALQVYKHIRPEERLPVMQAWFAELEDSLPPMTWYEFSACAGSTLGIFALVSYACGQGCDATLARSIKEAHFPWVQGLHILLDYLIDQDEDREGGDLNFCAHYPDRGKMQARLTHFYREANAGVLGLPYPSFHRFINQGLLAIYGSDAKVREQEPVASTVRRLILAGGARTWFFYGGCRLYRGLAPEGLLGGS